MWRRTLVAFGPRARRPSAPAPQACSRSRDAAIIDTLERGAQLRARRSPLHDLWQRLTDFGPYRIPPPFAEVFRSPFASTRTQLPQKHAERAKFEEK